ncbi:glycoside hydrolase family 65 protein [Lacticaseibacillus camelliae]|nr:glycosyl hydrolase family 65 protein [Lacticaseibacillus camelliae]
MKTSIKYHQDDPWRLSEATFDPAHLGKYEAIFALGNGYLGTRAATEEANTGEVRNTFVAGTFDRLNEDEVTELPNLPDVFQVALVFNGQRLDLNQGKVLDYERSLNLKTGELSRHFIWRFGRNRYRITTSRFVSLARRHVMGQRIEVTALDGDATLKLSAGINGQVTNTGTQHFNDDVKRLYPHHILQLTTKTNESQVNFAITTQHRLSVPDDRLGYVKTEMLRRRLRATYTLPLTKDDPLTFESITTVYTSRDLDVAYKDRASLRRQGYQAALALEKMNFRQLLTESAAAWADKLWTPMPLEIDTDHARDQLAINFARYHLQIMTPGHDSRMNVAAKGLSGEGYKGHTFWDTEIFLLPYFIFSQPEVARSLVTYRYLGLHGARTKAADNGYRGAQYPWEAAWVDDGESTPVWGATDIVTGEATKIWSGFIEQHITADVAYGVEQYMRATDDEEFARTRGNEIIIDTARFWCSRLEWNPDVDRYEINNVVGPDEYKEHANNNAFTNHMAHWNLLQAMQLIDRLKTNEPAEYQRLDERLDLAALRPEIEERLGKLYLPAPNAEAIIPEDDAYLTLPTIDLKPYLTAGRVGALFDDYNLEQVNHLQVTKQADVILLLFLFERHFSKRVKLKNWQYYEPRTTHDSSLSLLTHTNFAADLGLKRKAYSYYRRARDIDMGTNMNSSDEGIHAASIAGIWSMTVLGFGGVRYLDGRLRIEPNLPDQWRQLSFCLWWHGQKLAVTETNQTLKIRNLTGTRVVEIDHAGASVEIPTHDEVLITR